MSSSALYFEISDIVEHALTNSTVTGIQRSVVKIIEQFVRMEGNHRVFGLLRHPSLDKYVVADIGFMKRPYDLKDFAARFDLPIGKALWIHRHVKKYQHLPAKYLFHTVRRHTQWATSPKLRAEVLRFAKQAKPSCITALEPQPGGIFITLGAGWNTDYRSLDTYAKERGCRVVSFVHDIIPLMREKDAAFFVEDKNNHFANWIDFVGRNSALLVCNSRYTENELRRHLRRNGIAAATAVARFPHEFHVSAEREAMPVREEVTELLARGYALCVGTIGPRKNILALLEAWRELLAARPHTTPTLVLAGGAGRGASAVYDYLEKTGNLFGTVRLIERPNDLELEKLYANCRFTVFPSLFEGWGLPIGESLWFGKPVVCANNSAMPEVGGPYATYFDHKKPHSLLKALKSMVDNPVRLPANIRGELTTWADTAASIRAAVDSVDGWPPAELGEKNRPNARSKDKDDAGLFSVLRVAP